MKIFFSFIIISITILCEVYHNIRPIINHLWLCVTEHVLDLTLVSIWTFIMCVIVFVLCLLMCTGSDFITT